jgi:hypothetical protein
MTLKHVELATLTAETALKALSQFEFPIIVETQVMKNLW